MCSGERNSASSDTLGTIASGAATKKERSADGDINHGETVVERAAVWRNAELSSRQDPPGRRHCLLRRPGER